MLASLILRVKYFFSCVNNQDNQYVAILLPLRDCSSELLVKGFGCCRNFILNILQILIKIYYKIHISLNFRVEFSQFCATATSSCWLLRKFGLVPSFSVPLLLSLFPSQEGKGFWESGKTTKLNHNQNLNIHPQSHSEFVFYIHDKSFRLVSRIICLTFVLHFSFS